MLQQRFREIQTARTTAHAAADHHKGVAYTENQIMFSKIDIIDTLCFYRKKIIYNTPKRDFHVMSMRIDGSAVFEHNGKKYTVKENDILIIPAGIDYSQQTLGERVAAIHFNAETNLKEMKLYKAERINMSDKVMEIIKEFDRDDESKVYRAHMYFYDILRKLTLYNRDSREKEIKILNGVEYINENFCNPDLSVEKAAEMSYMSSAYFRKLFKNLYGKTPKEKLDELRINHACQLLKNGYCNVNEAAVQSGFYDPNYFSTVFKKKLGVSPSAFKKNRGILK